MKKQEQDINKTKICLGCNIEKTLDNFYAHKKQKFGVKSKCKKCESKISKEYRQNNSEKIKEQRIKYKQYHKEYYQSNSDIIKTRVKNWQLERKEELNEYWRTYRNKRHQTDLIFSIKNNLRCRINSSIKNNSKLSTSIDLLGCSIEEYKLYLEKQFDENMSWENWGTYWEIDHIKPLCTFDLSLKENQLLAFNYQNTQPLEKIKNRTKSKKYA
jgi:hypothetical protein